MKRSMILLVAAAGMMQSVIAQQSPPETISACDLLRNPVKFDGRVVAVRGLYVAEAHGAYLRAENCDGILPNDKFKWPPVIFVSLSQKEMESKDKDVRSYVRATEQMAAAIRSQIQLKGPGATPARVRVTFAGLFETRRDIENRPGDGFGPLNTAPGQLYVDAVRDVVVEFEDTEPKHQ